MLLFFANKLLWILAKQMFVKYIICDLQINKKCYKSKYLLLDCTR